jgi:hypothetical protein
MPNRLFLIHGMGKHEEGWHQPVVDTLRDIYDRYRVSKFVSFDDRFKVVALGYDDVLRDLLAMWQEGAEGVGQLAEGVDAEQVENLVGWLRDIDPDQFVWSHAADALLYRLFFDVRQTVRTTVARQIAEEITDLKANETWSVIAHSLGTAVVHDALDALWTGQLPGGVGTGFGPAQNKAQLVMMVANASRLLETSPDVYESTVRPGDSNDAESGCFHYLSARHRLDPVTIPRRFEPVNWPRPDSIAKGRYLPVEVWHIHDKNVHGWEHYLINPAVHVPMLRALTFPTAVTVDEEQAAHAEFPPFGNLSEGSAFEIKGELEDILPAVSDRWPRLREIWDLYVEFLANGGGD